MKKLSLIAGLACLATVGGVFGAWTFSEATYNGAPEKLISVSLETATNTGAIGTAAWSGDVELEIYNDEGVSAGIKAASAESSKATLTYTSLNANYTDDVEITFAMTITDDAGAGITVEAKAHTGHNFDGEVTGATKVIEVDTLNFITVDGDVSTYAAYQSLETWLATATFTLTATITASAHTGA